MLAHGRWFSPASSTTTTGPHDIAEILLKVVLNTKNQSINRKLSYPFTKECFKFCHAWRLLGSYHSEITTTVYCKIVSNTDILMDKTLYKYTIINWLRGNGFIRVISHQRHLNSDLHFHILIWFFRIKKSLFYNFHKINYLPLRTCLMTLSGN